MGMSFNSGNPGGPYQARPDMGPGVGFGPGLPQQDFGGGLNPGQVLGGGIDAIFGATPIGGAFNQALGGQSFGNVVGNGVNTAIGQTPIGNMFGGGQQQAMDGLGNVLGTALSGAGAIMGQTPIGGAFNQALGQAGMGGGKSLMPGQPQGLYTPRPDLGPGVGFGPGLPQPNPFSNLPKDPYDPIYTRPMQTSTVPQGGVYGRDLSGNPNMAPMQGGMGTMATTPINRGIPVQQARRINPPITRTRTRR